MLLVKPKKEENRPRSGYSFREALPPTCIQIATEEIFEGWFPIPNGRQPLQGIKVFGKGKADEQRKSPTPEGIGQGV